MSNFMDETDGRIPDGLTPEQESRFVEVYNGMIASRNSEADALAQAERAIITPEDRMTDIGGPEEA